MTDMAAGIEEGIDTRTVIKKVEGSKSARDVIREQVSYSGIEIPPDSALERRLKEKYGSVEYTEAIPLTEQEYEEAMAKITNERVVNPVRL